MAARRLGTFLPLGILALCIAWMAFPGNADTHAVIGQLSTRIESSRLLASFRLDHAFDDDFQRKVRSGLPTDIIYHFELRRSRRNWFDASVAESRVQVVAMYNATTEEYLVNFKHDGELVNSRSVREVDAVRAMLTRVEDFPVFSLASRDPDDRLILRVRAELGTKTFLAFIPRTIRSDWAATDPFRLDRP